MVLRLFWAFFAAVAALGLSAEARLNLPKALGSGMVLQRAPERAILWGWAVDWLGRPLKERVQITFRDEKLVVTSDPTYGGVWVAALPPTDAGGPYTIVIDGPLSFSPSLRHRMKAVS